MAQHANLPPSGAERWVPCPGSIALEASIPEAERPGSSVYADMGTAAHGLLERCLTEDVHADSYMGRVVVLTESGVSILPHAAKAPGDPSLTWFVVDEDMADAVEVCLEYVRSNIGCVQTERRVRVLGSRDDCWGTADVTLDDWPVLLEVADYKNGYMIVEVKDNKQILSYLLGVAREDGFSYERYRGTIVQPNASHPDGPVRSFEVTEIELRLFEDELESAADRVDQALGILGAGATVEELDDNGFLAGGSHCFWCEAKERCPAHRRMIEEQAGMDFDDEPTDLTVPTDLGRLGQMMKWVPVFESFIKSVCGTAERLAMAGTKVPGQKIVRGKSAGRKWMATFEDEEGNPVPATDDEIVRRCVELGIARKDLYKIPEPSLLTGPQAEKLLPKKERGPFSDAMMFKPEGKPTLAPEDDSRPEITVNPGDDFDDLED
jgi:hypothetical protein